MDKRTKEYKEWKKAHDEDTSIGLGDAVEKVTKATGIKKAVDVVFDKLGKDCGCDKRKKALNKVSFRFKPVRCFTEDLYNQWAEFRKHKGDLNNEHIKLIHDCYEQLFVKTFKRQSCCYEGFIKEINKVYDKYQ
jgi:hypothetical protein